MAKCLVLCGISHYNNAAKQEPPMEIEPLLVFSSWRKQRENLFAFIVFVKIAQRNIFPAEFSCMMSTLSTIILYYFGSPVITIFMPSCRFCFLLSRLNSSIEHETFWPRTKNVSMAESSFESDVK